VLKTKKGERNLSGKRKTALASHHPTPEQKKKKNIESITKKRKVPETKLHAAPKKKSRTLSSTTQYLPGSPVSSAPVEHYQSPIDPSFCPQRSFG